MPKLIKSSDVKQGSEKFEMEIFMELDVERKTIADSLQKINSDFNLQVEAKCENGYKNGANIVLFKCLVSFRDLCVIQDDE